MPEREPSPQPAQASRVRAVAIVPARLASSRMPRKMLRRDTGSYLFEHTLRNVEGSRAAETVVLATDSEEILSAAAEVGLDALLTSPEHRSGTDRVLEAVQALRAAGRGPWDVVLNVQGDEPELPAEPLRELVSAFGDERVELATLRAPLGDPREAEDPNVVKVVCDADGWALYFSRAPIPSSHHPGAQAGTRLWRHVGVYAFRPRALERFCSLPTGGLEAAESLEQLRWLESGGRIRVLSIGRAPRDINTEEQYAAFVSSRAGTLEGSGSP